MDADGSKWRDQVRWSLSAERVTSAAVEDTASSSEPTVALRASVRRHDAREATVRRFGRSDRRARGDRSMLRSIRPTRARRPFDASVDPTEAA
jgi:hypothetical protein